MHPREQLVLERVQIECKRKSTKVYLGLLSRLLMSHSGYSFLKPLSDALRAKDFLKLYTEADFLSEQKYSDATQHFVANQFALLIKKYPWPTDLLDLKPRDCAIKSFHASEKRCDLVNRKFAILGKGHSRDRFRGEGNGARNWIRKVIGSTPNYRKVFENADFGPGASVGVHGDATNYLAKQCAKRWSVTPGALHHGYAAVRQNFQLWETLLPRKNGLSCYDEEAAFNSYLGKLSVVDNNNISFVPKTAKTNRTIAVEPLMNGLVQKGIDQVLRTRLAAVGIDLKSQQRNQEMARLGSLNDGDDGFVTIDMKSASDSVSIELVRYLLPDDWFRLLDRTRSKRYKLDEVLATFEKFCSMGNGFCFPLETLIFASACIACGAGTPHVDFMVYGDDIIVRKLHATKVISLLLHWGFKTNNEKTFLSGPFRESCGKDWFGGQDVRPFTLDYALDSIQCYFKYLNLTRRSERCESFFLDERAYVVKQLPQRYRFFRPFKGNEDTGIDSTGDEFLYTPTCIFLPRKNKWQWEELSFRPVVDYDTIIRSKDEPWLIGVALRGAPSINKGHFKFLPEVTLRNRAQAKVVRKDYVTTSNWLPPPHDMVIRRGVRV